MKTIRFASLSASLALAGALVSGCGAAATEVDGSSSEALTNGPSGSIVAANGNCLRASGTTNGALIDTQPCTAGAAGQWFMYSTTQQFLGRGGKAVDAIGWATNEGAPVGMWDVDGAWNQRWKLTNAEIHGLGGKAVDALYWDTNEGSPVGIWSVDGAANQKWTFTLDGQMQSWDGRCLDVLDVRTGESWSVPDGASITLRTCRATSKSQKWTVMPGGMIVGWGQKCMTVQNAVAVDGARLVSWTCNGGSNQVWNIASELRDWNEQCLEVAGPRLDYRPPTSLRACTGAANQRFSFFP